VFLERGLGATTSEVARRAKISESVIFHRYKTKEALFLAILERQMNLAPELEGLGTLVGQGDVAEHLNSVGMVLIAKMRAIRPFFMLAFSSPTKMRMLQERVRRVHPMYVRLLADYLEAEARAGRLRGVDAQIMAHTFLGGVREYLFVELFPGSRKSVLPAATRYVRGMVDILLRGATTRDRQP